MVWLEFFIENGVFILYLLIWLFDSLELFCMLVSFLDSTESATSIPPTKPPCTSPSVRCPGSSLCIKPTQMCDGKTDCPDGSDEKCVRRCPFESKSVKGCNPLQSISVTPLLLSMFLFFFRFSSHFFLFYAVTLIPFSRINWLNI